MKKIAELIYGEYLKDFDVVTAKRVMINNEDGEIRILFREKETRKPFPNLVSNGYLNQLEVVDNPAAGCAVYLQFERRRWIDPETKEGYHNSYNLKISGTKVTQRFGFFLKEKDRREIDEFLMFFPLLRPTVEEALVVVQKPSVGVRKPCYKRIFT